jgi:probable rRNA maturation factor
MAREAEPAVACLSVDVAVEHPGWAAIAADWPDRAEALARASLDATPFAALLNQGSPVELAIDLADDARVRALNADWRAQDKPTNVLSFPGLEPDALADLVSGRGPKPPVVLLGDIILAYETVEREAAEQGKTIADHAAHLIVHGCLHLLGHDHGEDGEADAMEALECRILSGFGIADPYGWTP